VTTAFTASATVGHPAAEVWAHLTDWPAAPAWMTGVDRVRVDGATLTFHTRGRDRTARVEIADPGRTVIVHSSQGGVTAAYTYTCVPDGASTVVTLTADCRAGGLWRPFAPLLRAAIRRADSGQPAALKRVIERGRSAASAQ
jgi:carbon monoxide dehydrogenase subunit G